MPSSGPGSYVNPANENQSVGYIFVIDNPAEQMWRYEQGAFQLGQLNSGALGTPTASGVTVTSTQGGVNWTYCGFQLMYTLRYTWATTLTRIDNGQSWVSPSSTPWDSWRYFSTSSNTVACLPLTDYPSVSDCASIGTVCTMLEGGNQGQAFGFLLPQRGPFQDTDGKYGV